MAEGLGYCSRNSQRQKWAIDVPLRLSRFVFSQHLELDHHVHDQQEMSHLVG